MQLVVPDHGPTPAVFTARYLYRCWVAGRSELSVNASELELCTIALPGTSRKTSYSETGGPLVTVPAAQSTSIVNSSIVLHVGGAAGMLGNRGARLNDAHRVAH